MVKSSKVKKRKNATIKVDSQKKKQRLANKFRLAAAAILAPLIGTGLYATYKVRKGKKELNDMAFDLLMSRG